MGKWTEEEIDFLKKNYKNHSNKWVAEQLGKTIQSIYHKAQTLKLKTLEFPHKRTWTDKQDEFVKKNYGKLPTKEIARIINKSHHAINHRASKLKVVKEESKLWTKEEIQFLKENYYKLNNTEINKILKRGVEAITAKAMKMGLIKRNQFRTKCPYCEKHFINLSKHMQDLHIEEFNQIIRESIELKRKGWSNNKIAKRYNLSRGTIRNNLVRNMEDYVKITIKNNIKRTPEIIQKTLELRKKGLNIFKIAKEVPISSRTVHRLLIEKLGKNYKRISDVITKEILKKAIELRKQGYTIHKLEKELNVKRATIEASLRKHMGQKEFKKYVNYCVLECANMRHNKAKETLKKYLERHHNFIKIEEEKGIKNGNRPDFITTLKKKYKISWDVVVSNSDLKNLYEEIKKKFNRGYEKYSKLCFIILFSNLNGRKDILKRLQKEAPKGMIILDSDFMLSDEVIAPFVFEVMNCKYSSKGKLQITPNFQTELIKV